MESLQKRVILDKISISPFVYNYNCVKPVGLDDDLVSDLFTLN